MAYFFKKNIDFIHKGRVYNILRFILRLMEGKMNAKKILFVLLLLFTLAGCTEEKNQLLIHIHIQLQIKLNMNMVKN